MKSTSAFRDRAEKNLRELPGKCRLTRQGNVFAATVAGAVRSVMVANFREGP